MTIVRRVVVRLATAAVIATILGGTVVTGGEQPAAACSCGGLTDNEALAQADAAFIGTVTAVERPEPLRSSTDPVTWSFTVEQVFKGDVTAIQEVVSVAGPESCGLALDQYQRYLVFADARQEAKSRVSIRGTDLAADLCGGTRFAGLDEAPAMFPPSMPPSTTAASPRRAKDKPGSVQLTLSKTHAPPGATLMVTFGGTDLDVFVRGLASQLERRKDGHWEPTHTLIAGDGDRLGTPRSFPVGLPYPTLDLVVIGLRGAGPDTLQLPEDAASGRYRICTPMIRDASGRWADRSVSERQITPCAKITVRSPAGSEERAAREASIS